MRIILLTDKPQTSTALSMNSGIVFALAMAALVTFGLVGYAVGVHYNWLNADMLPKGFAGRWEAQIESQAIKVDETLARSQDQFDALSVRMAELQARLVRLDALGERLVGAANLKGEEFDFAEKPPVGGPQEEDGQEADLSSNSYEKLSLFNDLEQLTQSLEAREAQLAILADLMSNRKLNDDVFLAGRPVLRGWMSSRYGRRTDPFSGRPAWHKGVDFAGKTGSDIISVAAGIVTYASNRKGYGNLVEINHGNGFVTRYGHCQTIKVATGDLVRTGDVIATMGSTGRSTGPHVHFEVIKDGRHVDPALYINRSKKKSG